MIRRLTIAGVAALAVLPASADAHITLQPKEAPAEAFTVENVRVPNERSDTATTKVDVQFPPGFIFASYEPVRGWTVKIAKRKLAKPVESHGEQITEEVARVTWTATSAANGVQPGQFRDFPLSVRIPGKAGDTLTFKALQTYSDGEVVRWIGAPDSDEPAPTVRVTAAAEEHATAPGAPARPPAAADDDDDDDGGSNGLAIAALALAAVALVVSLARFRRA